MWHAYIWEVVKLKWCFVIKLAGLQPAGFKPRGGRGEGLQLGFHRMLWRHVNLLDVVQQALGKEFRFSPTMNWSSILKKQYHKKNVEDPDRYI